MKGYRFRPRPWAVLLTLLLAGGMAWAGFWQYDRGVHKEAMRTYRAALANGPTVPFPEGTAALEGELIQVEVEGRYQNALTLLLDNQPSRDQPGVHVWTPLLLADGRLVIVDRGWVALSDVQWRAPPKAPEKPQRVVGTWRALPRAAMHLGEQPDFCAVERPQLVNYPDAAAVRCLFGAATVDGLLELAPNMPAGFGRLWASAGANEVPPARHYAYAAQWWLFALTLVALFVKINLKKSIPAP